MLNLHVCPKGCKWQTSGTEYDSVEKEFQHNKVQSHGMTHEADALFEIDNPQDIMFWTHDLIPEVSEQWEHEEHSIIEFCCKNKFNHYIHARQALMHAKAELVEGTLNKKWGSGLDVVWTKECHPDYWPGWNVIG